MILIVQHFRKRFTFRKIRSRFVAAMILLSIPPLFFLGFVSYHITQNTIIQNHIGNNGEHLKTAGRVADLKLDEVIQLERLILSNPQLRQDLIASDSNESADTHVIGIRTANRLEKIISDYLIDMHHIESVCLFDNHFRSVCHGRSDLVYGRQPIHYAESDWYSKAVEARGKELFFSYNVLENEERDTFSSVKLLNEPRQFGLQPIGLLVVNINKTLFSDVFSPRGESNFIIVDTSTQPVRFVYPSEPGWLDMYANGDISSFIQQMYEAGYLVGHFIHEKTGWTFMHVTESGALLQTTYQIGMMTAFIATLIALTALIFSFVLSSTITRPLLQIKKMMIEWAQGTRKFNATFAADEIGAIGETFKTITRENEQLTERLIHSRLKERESELRALQAQINPHFLYNTLDSIYWMAVLRNHQDVAQMAVSLSESFKLSLNKGKETIPVFKELQHIDHYMTILNIRYNHRFQWVKEVAPELMGQEILKLLLQPLVENAVYHGLEPKVGPGKIRLTGKIHKGEIIFTVEDDGVGMHDGSVTKNGYGLQNIRDRLQLYYGSTSSLLIESEKGVGTKVQLRFPLRRGKQHVESRNF